MFEWQVTLPAVRNRLQAVSSDLSVRSWPPQMSAQNPKLVDVPELKLSFLPDETQPISDNGL